MITDLRAVSRYIGPGYTEDEVRTAWLAAESYISKRCRWVPEPVVGSDGLPTVDDEGEPVLGAPASLAEAVKLLTARYLARRKSPDGLIGMGEFQARVPVIDGDVRALIGPYRPAVV